MNRYLALILATFIALALGYSVTIPLGEASDEVPHWAYVQYLRAHRELPKSEGAVLGESHQPPLYYVIGALATFWIPAPDFPIIANPDFVLDDPQTPNVLLHTRREAFPYRDVSLAWRLVRALSIAMGAVTVWATWRLAREIFPEGEEIALGAAAFVAFLPGFLAISAVVNNDNLIVMLASLTALQVVRIARRRLAWRWRDFLLLGVLLGLAPLTKLSGLVLWLFAASVLLFLAVKTRHWKEIALRSALAVEVGILILAPWVLANLARYGDPFGWSLVLATTEVRQTPMTWDDWAFFVRGMYTSFWGRFGGVVHLSMSDAVYAALGGPGILALVGWVANARATRLRFDQGARILVASFGGFWAILLAAHIRWTLVVGGTDQARQIYPGLPLLAIVLVAGWGWLFGPRRKMVFAMGGAASAAFALAVLVYLGSVFAAPLQDVNALAPLGGVNRPADFGDTIRVADYRVDRTQVAPGDALTVQVYWQALADPGEDYWLLLQLTGKEGAIANKDGVPCAGRLTTDWWKAGQGFTSRHTLIVPDNVSPGNYTLQLGLHPFGRWEWLPVNGREILELEPISVTTR
ncbi:MAG: glycosyltransferase family 39 protein [Chloroflexi bacterium]|nr:glycosyltransferase family 39 protein [Chloroflexota bacterium]